MPLAVSDVENEPVLDVFKVVKYEVLPGTSTLIRVPLIAFPLPSTKRPDTCKGVSDDNGLWPDLQIRHVKSPRRDLEPWTRAPDERMAIGGSAAAVYGLKNCVGGDPDLQ